MTTAAAGIARAALNRLLAGESLAQAEAGELLVALTDENLPPALAGAVLAALRTKGETADEIRGFATAMRELARDPGLHSDGPAIDIVGTGGDDSGSVNLSTGAALLTAASGLTVIKHGNRSVSSKSGSADVLEVLGLPMPLDEAAGRRALAELNFTFLFAPFFHPAMKAIAPVRAALGARTVFNILGPLTNPARPPFALIGAYSEAMAKIMAETLAGMDLERAFVIHGEPGWDEATPVGEFVLFDVRDGKVGREVRTPEDYRLERCQPEDLRGGDAEFNAEALRGVLEGRDHGAHYDALCLGAALALEVADLCSSKRSAMAQVRETINAGRGAALLKSISEFQGKS